MNISEQIERIHSELQECEVLLPHHFMMGITNEGIEAYCDKLYLDNHNMPIMDGIDGQKLFGILFTHRGERTILTRTDFEDMGEI